MKELWLTRKTLLLKIADHDNELAWEEFFNYYSPFIYHIFKHSKVDQFDQDDLAQIIILKLWERLKFYDSEKKPFREWLKEIITRETKKFYVKKKKESCLLPELDNFNEPDINRIIESEWEGYLTDLAMEKVRFEFSENSVKAFLMGVEGLPHEEIAKKIHVTVESVKVLKARVKKFFLQEMKKLIETLERQ